jgi:myo-inositol catabolism protein IolC
MPRGYDKPLYILPFDHRHSYGSEVFGYHEPLTAEQTADIAASKQVIYEGFLQAVQQGVPRDRAGILVDEEFGASILRDAKSRGTIFAMSTEKSGQHEFDFEYGEDFGKHIEEFGPTFAKTLVRSNPEGDAAMNDRQTKRLKRLSDYLAGTPSRLMFELLVPPEDRQLRSVAGDKGRYDRELRPKLVVQAIRNFQDAGIEADVWKIEGLDSADDCRRVVETVQRDGREKVGCIVLGRGENEAKVLEWIRVAAAVPGFIGFAVGRSSFLAEIVGMRNGSVTRDQAVARIAAHYLEWTREFEKVASQR